MSKELTENVANNVAQREMQDLTEKWKNGTLKTGSYYIRIITGNEKSDYFEGKKFCFWSDHEIEEVLAPVPSYEEWEELQESNDGLSKLMFKSLMNKFVKADEEREKLEEENIELVTKCHRLEELLKRCRDSVEFDKREALGGGADYQAKILSALLKEIDEVLR